MRAALVALALVAGCNTEIDLTLTFDGATVSAADVDRLTLLHFAVDGIERTMHDAQVGSPKRSQRIIYQPRASSGRLDFLVGAADPSQPDQGSLAAGTASVEIHAGQATPLELVLYGPGGPGPVDGGTFEGDLSGFGATDAGDDAAPDDAGQPLDGPPPDLMLVKHCVTTPGIYLCDNFDGVALNPQWSIAGDVTLDSADSRSTPKSLRAASSNGGPGSQFGVVAPAMSVRQQMQSLWIRVYLHQSGSNTMGDTVIFNASDANGNGYGIVVNKSNKLALVKTTGPNLTVLGTSTVSLSTTTFECFTWQIDAGLHTELRKNDAPITALTANGIILGPIESWSFGSGPDLPPTVAMIIHFDDILVDDQPLTCAQ